MLWYQQIIITASSFIVRLVGYAFLRWIPGHHGPPILFTALSVYLTTIWIASHESRHPATRSPTESRQKNGGSKASVPRFMSRVNALETIVTGLPSTTSKAATAFTITINAVLVIFALDLVLRSSIYPASELAFSRVGYVSPTTAKILVREPRQEMLPLHLWYYKLTDGQEEAKVEAAILHSLDDSKDFTSPLTLSDLEPSTHYRYSLSNDLSGEFTTAPSPGSNQLTFVTSSCIKPNFPYNPLSHPLRIPGLELMSRGLANFPTISPPAFMLFLGDFIYIDVPMRFGSSVSAYRREYQKVYLSPSWKASQTLTNLPWIHTLDDHEIANDWASGNTTAPFPAAVDPYRHYHVSVNPPIPEHPFSIPANTTYFSFTNGPASFFMLDNRAYRTPPSLDNSTMLGSAQLQSLLDYISQPEPEGVKWKIVSSSVPFTKNWRVGTPDTWGGYLKERRVILEAMWKAERDLGLRIVLLSGDRHEFGATRFPDPLLASSPELPETFSGPGRGIHEFCVGPLSQFYFPFRSYRQEDDQDVEIKYTPDGNFKFGAVEIDTHGEGADRRSDLVYSLYVNGEVVWKYRLSVPLERSKEADLFPPGEVLLDKVDYWTGFERVFGPEGRVWNAGWVRRGLTAVLGSERLDEA